MIFSLCEIARVKVSLIMANAREFYCSRLFLHTSVCERMSPLPLSPLSPLSPVAAAMTVTMSKAGSFPLMSSVGFAPWTRNCIELPVYRISTLS